MSFLNSTQAGDARARQFAIRPGGQVYPVPIQYQRPATQYIFPTVTMTRSEIAAAPYMGPRRLLELTQPKYRSTREPLEYMQPYMWEARKIGPFVRPSVDARYIPSGIPSTERRDLSGFAFYTRG